eukprot:295686-Rhodomonas_salina.3
MGNRKLTGRRVVTTPEATPFGRLNKAQVPVPSKCPVPRTPPAKVFATQNVSSLHSSPTLAYPALHTKGHSSIPPPWSVY